jgi:hypothetical protein
MWWALLSAGCMSEPETPQDDGAGGDGSDDIGEITPAPTDEFDELPSPVDDSWTPPPFTATRFGVFYQISKDVLDHYQDSTVGLPKVAGHAWIITHSHATAYASKALAALVHRRADFLYAPAFDIFDAAHEGWTTAPDAQLRTWAHAFRDAAIKAHADLFTFNESPTTTGTNENVRVRIAKILRFLHEPDPQGRQLWGITYLTQRASNPETYDSAASDFFKAIDETSIALVAEYYHSNGYICGMSLAALSDHFFALRRWLVASGEPAKLSLANKKFTVLHSARYEAGPSGWAGGDANQTTLANYQRALSRATLATRMTEGGVNRLSFGPTATSITQFGVQPRITALFRHHYLHTAAQASETTCIDNFAGNCACD